jgi:hypothetical protein
MGSRRNPTIIALEYDDSTSYPGLEIKLRSATLDQLFEIADVADLVPEINGNLSKEQRAALLRLRDELANRLVSWNREDEQGVPLAPTLANLKDEEPAFVLRIIYDWMDGIQRVPNPLSDGSNGGGQPSTPTLPTLDLPMEPLPLPASSPELDGS